MNRVWGVISLLSVIFIFGCSTPKMDYDYQKLDREGYDTRDTLLFKVSMTGGIPHTISFATRTDKSFISPTINAEIHLMHDSTDVEIYRVSIPADRILKSGVRKSSSQNGVYDMVWEWSDDYTPVGDGICGIKMVILNRDGEDHIIKGIHEIGINCRENERKR